MATAGIIKFVSGEIGPGDVVTFSYPAGVTRKDLSLSGAHQICTFDNNKFNEGTNWTIALSLTTITVTSIDMQISSGVSAQLFLELFVPDFPINKIGASEDSDSDHVDKRNVLTANDIDITLTSGNQDHADTMIYKVEGAQTGCTITAAAGTTLNGTDGLSILLIAARSASTEVYYDAELDEYIAEGEFN